MVFNVGKNIAAIVRSDFRTAEVFKMYNIDMYNEGNNSLASICEREQLNIKDILVELEAATRNISLPNDLPFHEWKIDFLVEYILHIHHAYLFKSLAKIEAELFPGAVDKNENLAITGISAAFSKLSTLLLKHNQHEEAVVFPYIKQLEVASKHQDAYGSLFVRTLRKPLSIIEKEHGDIHLLLLNLKSITNNFVVADDASLHHRVLIHKMQELYMDLLQHHRLEENYLYPRAFAIEQQLLMNESS
jgi:regulator of cell morphogenesis and NO signaling